MTKYGWPEMVILPVVPLAVMIIIGILGRHVLATGVIIAAELILACILLWLLAFFRDPSRFSPPDEKNLLAPADGRIVDIGQVDKSGFAGGIAFRVGIFLSIFDVHINRCPCNADVEKIIYKKGKYKNALSPASAQVNESNELWLLRAEKPNDKIVVRQISGAIARRIVCSSGQGNRLRAGEKFGMIKFGSRTELYFPVSEKIKCMVKKADKVKAGLTVIARYTG